jgi:hypothetical protein
MSQFNCEVPMVDPKELSILIGLIRQLEYSPLPQNPNNVLQEGMAELSDRIIAKIRRHVSDGQGRTNMHFVQAMQASGFSVLNLQQDLISCHLYGVPTTKGMVEIRPH